MPVVGRYQRRTFPYVPITNLSSSAYTFHHFSNHSPRLKSSVSASTGGSTLSSSGAAPRRAARLPPHILVRTLPSSSSDTRVGLWLPCRNSYSSPCTRSIFQRDLFPWTTFLFRSARGGYCAGVDSNDSRVCTISIMRDTFTLLSGYRTSPQPPNRQPVECIRKRRL